jgi:hypothetical protein
VKDKKKYQDDDLFTIWVHLRDDERNNQKQVNECSFKDPSEKNKLNSYEFYGKEAQVDRKVFDESSS